MKIGEFRSNIAVMIYCHGKSKCPYYLKASELSGHDTYLKFSLYIWRPWIVPPYASDKSLMFLPLTSFPYS